MGNSPLGVVFPAEFLMDLYWGPFFIYCILRHWETYIENMDFLFIFNADDTQIYTIFKPLINGSLEYSKNLIQECTRDMSIWMRNNKLKLKDDKTDLLVLTARHPPQPPKESIVVGCDLFFPSEIVKNLGTVFDTSLSLEKQVTAVCKVGFYHLRNIARVRKHLSFESNQVLIHAYVTSKLDYCNSLYYGLPDFLIKKLQYIQNLAARLLTGIPANTITLPLFVKNFTGFLCNTE